MEEAGSDLNTNDDNDDYDYDTDIRLINEAKSILLDPIKKQQWLDSFSSTSTITSAKEPTKTGPHIFRNISLDEFTPHHTSQDDREKGENEDEDEDDQQPEYFTYPCRCSSEFKITLEQLEENVEVVGCEGCGEWIRVGYEVVEEDDQHHPQDQDQNQA
ncbi:hypothetical protein L486_02849 [Kwoniella mangroviensis CBS 10435]|uniref:DPH-type MB domain-containing protein n=1 Tax=Kwoniella mangroviensis CBS 10435 TaxID=1331196 RepID=A0A1B9IXC3_9TREE|nr:uncharacterized protein I203_01314 [Kwoniella mangroviensis CBS 8507]OCF60169.1 hypothetical protein L486_02849 [Kwoniella mangroviensis CBS 10435]OCF69457.1 hypothetical protein I203_01314 [Kwoniella mangroviensis CBS 8507]OCF72334.1 hypothetical protein I204_06713 [Kwoniella mangroviensis CBS 8886]